MKHLNIFIVEDEMIYACLLQYSIKSQIDGNVELFESYNEMRPFLEDQPDFLVLDYYLENENGFEVQQLVKEKSPKTKIIFVSGAEDESVKMQAIENGAFDYLPKDDFTFQNLLRIFNATNA